MRRSTIHTALLFFTAMVVCRSATAQSVKAEVDRTKILIGEQIQLKLTVENARTIGSWFTVPDSLNHMEVVERGKIDTLNVGNLLNYQQIITITSFDSGQWQIPPLIVKGVAQPTQPITIDVLPVDVSHMKDYHDIKDIEEVEPASSWMIIAAIVLLTLLSIIGIFWLYNKRRPAPLPVPVMKGDQTPLEWALSSLNELQQQQLYIDRQAKQHYLRLTDIVRTYFHLQLKHPALYETTDEWMVRLQSVPTEQQVKTSFFQLLRLSETVKFAKYIPPTEESERSVEVARQMVTNVAAVSAHAAYQPK